MKLANSPRQHHAAEETADKTDSLLAAALATRECCAASAVEFSHAFWGAQACPIAPTNAFMEQCFFD
ncbi:hypothetical protein ETAA8_69300 [Anatilimnocola aggregata]|uniref:Uncharacterized protein n=1 Tax=Anatilimnocola aggregata TaxID=2528021 RepID=A0A517YNI6_9BACT|nr:hypothetical protein ETAA8_69300 [Anatilimnocola aggregata]